MSALEVAADSATFDGYARSDGRPGVRNRLLLLCACGLNAAGARRVAAALVGADALDSVRLVSSPYGRGQVGADKALHERMLTGFGRHPNVGAVLLFVPDDGMGEGLAAPIRASGRPVGVYSLQAFGEDGARMAAAAIDEAHARLAELAVLERTAQPIDRLVIATECGHSDASSGIVANPLVGGLVDAMVARGARALLGETLEWTGGEPLLRARAASRDIAARLETMLAARHAIAAQAGLDVYLGNPGPQNHAGGLTTLEEKSLGALMKGGNTPIVGALEHGEAVPDAPGLYLMDTPTLSPESLSAMVVAGAQIALFTTGHGNPYGSALAPTLKITANPETAARLPDQIDLDAAAVFEGREALEQAVTRLRVLVLRTASGLSCAAERAGEQDEAISRALPST